jgi:hypothetical protein
VTVPVTSVPKVTVARSRTGSPTWAELGVALVVIPVGDLATVTVSSGSRHAVGPAGLLLASPL